MKRKYRIIGLIAAITVLSTALATVNGDWYGSLLHKGGRWWKISPSSGSSIDDVTDVTAFTVIWAQNTVPYEKEIKIERWYIKGGMIEIELDKGDYHEFVKSMSDEWTTISTEAMVTDSTGDYPVIGPAPGRRSRDW